MELLERIFSSSVNENFDSIALDLYAYQLENCSVYKQYVRALNRAYPTKISEIPFLPISFFKSHKVIHSAMNSELIFKSSGTGGERSSHYVANVNVYSDSFNNAYSSLIGNPEGQIICALLPNYIDQGDSSLVYMVNELIKRSESDHSAFILNDISKLKDAYHASQKEGKQFILFGVSYALLDLCEIGIDLSDAIIIETGGMKGRRKELTKDELHAVLKNGLNCNFVYSEYGMTELLSQAYSLKDGIFHASNTMKILIRDINDPFHYVDFGKTGGVNVIDLANIYSCSFIATQDLGREEKNGFKIMGRFDNSDIRGCNLLVQ